MRLVDIDPAELNPLSLALVGKLGDVLTGAGFIEAVDESRGWRRYQLLRYFCGSDAFARLVRLQIIVAGEVRQTITPKGAADELYLEGLVSPGQPLTLRIVRDPLTSAVVLPNPFPDVDVRFEVFG
ncbi:MAG: hypothetical protein Q8K67_11290 [Geothrix sp.]|nr:hypothetical protein [Geothrix sp.]